MFDARRKISGLKARVLLRTGETYDDFVEQLEEAERRAECRYAVFDADFQLSDGQKRSKLVFFFWQVLYFSH